jgi:carboxylesterase
MSAAATTDKRHVWLEDSYHVATLDNDLPVIVDESLAFIRSHVRT